VTPGLCPDDGHEALTVGSCAAEHHEPGQIRKEAALSGSFRVPQGNLTRAHARYRRRPRRFDGGGTIIALAFLCSRSAKSSPLPGFAGTPPFGGRNGATYLR